MTQKFIPPDFCELCGKPTKGCWDFHMICQHPETRPKPQYHDDTLKGKKKK